MTDQKVFDDLIWMDFEGLRGSIPQPLMRGGRYEFEAADVHEAVSLAETLKAHGRYQYFRGQVDSDWTVTSTMSRRTPAEREVELDAIRAFWSWVRNSPEMVPYLQSDDQIIAAIQHHGIAATPFIDLTHEPTVAGWFATERHGATKYGAIYLLDRERLSKFFQDIAGAGPTFRFLEIDVANLWRLQAQSGLFLECNANLEAFWPLDRIVFPQTGALSPVAESAIYPIRASHLEQMIRLHEVLDERSRRFTAMINDPHSPIKVYEVASAPAEAPEASAPATAVWAMWPDERWDVVDPGETDCELELASLQSYQDALVGLIERRRRCTELVTVIAENELKPGRMQAMVNTMWAGLRPFPYTPSEIASALAALVRFDSFFRDFDLGAGMGTFGLAQAHLDDPLEIEMGLFGGGSTRCCVSSARLIGAFKKTGRERLGLSRDATASLLTAALIQAEGVRIGFFDEDRFRALLVDEIIPWQVISERNPVVYAASQIEVLGAP